MKVEHPGMITLDLSQGWFWNFVTKSSGRKTGVSIKDPTGNGFPKIGSTRKVNYQLFATLAGKGGGILKVPGDDICLLRLCSTKAVCWKHIIGSHQCFPSTNSEVPMYLCNLCIGGLWLKHTIIGRFYETYYHLNILPKIGFTTSIHHPNFNWDSWAPTRLCKPSLKNPQKRSLKPLWVSHEDLLNVKHHKNLTYFA